MEIARERFLDDSRTYHLSVGIRSRTTAAHSLLTALTDDERAQVSAAIVRALDEVARIVRPHMDAPST
jgi:phage-related protein